MKKFLSLVSLCLLGVYNLSAQNVSLQEQTRISTRLHDLEVGRQAIAKQHNDKCAYDIIRDKQLQDPEVAKEEQKFQLAVSKYIEKNRSQLESRKAGVLTVPIVFHVLHQGEAVGTGNNIPEAQILSSIEALNRDFRRSADDGGVAQGAGPDTEIEFCLASKDPSGNPHSGINRIDASGQFNYDNIGIDEDVNGTNLKNLSKWSTNDYVNVWVVREINNQDPYPTWTGGTLGYAYRVTGGSAVNPNTNPAGNTNDGIVVANFALGNDPDNSESWRIFFNLNRTLTHEMGHHLNLQHTFAGGSCATESDCTTQGDYVCDTPPTTQQTNCNTPACSGTQQVENYMDYTGEVCADMFSAGQVVRMRAVLEGFSRSSLIASDVCGSVPPTADFEADDLIPCLNSTVEFTNLSLRTVDTYTWSISPATFTYVNGTNANSENIAVQFTAAGNYTVSLTATNSAGSDTETKTDYIVAGSGKSLPYSEDWEDAATYTEWGVSNPDGLTTWSVADVAGNTPGTKAAFVNNSDYDDADGAQLRDGLISPVLDFSGYTSVTLDFDQAYARYSANYQDSLAVYVSTDCGATFTKVAFYKDATLKTRADLTTGAFVPASANDWCGAGGFADCIEIDLSAYAGESAVQIKWENISNWGNNLYIDNINVTGVAGAAPVADFSADKTSGCEGEGIKLTDASTETPTSWVWSATPSAGVTFSPSNTAQNPGITFANAGTYTIELTATNATGSDAETKTDYITVEAIPTVEVSITASENTICAGDNVDFTATPTNEGSTSTINWYVNDVLQATTGTSFSSTTLQSNDVVKARIIAEYTCGKDTSFSGDETIIVEEVLDAGIDITSTSTTICSGDPVTFTATLSDEGTTNVIEWYVNNVLDGSTGATFTTSTLADGDEVKARVIATYSCGKDTSMSNEIQISVGSLPSPEITISALTTTICPGDDLDFTAAVTNDGVSSVITWYVNDAIQVPTGAAFTASGLVDGDVVKAKIVATYSCGVDSSESNELTITVSSTQNPEIAISTSETTVCAGADVVVDATISNAGTTVTDWFFNNTNQSENGASYTATINANDDAVFARLISTTSCSIDTVYSDTIAFTVITQDTSKIDLFFADDTICEGVYVFFNPSVINAEADSLKWFVNGVFVEQTTLFGSTNFADGDEIYARVINEGPCRIDTAYTDTITMVVNPIPAVGFTPNQASEACVDGDLVQLAANPSGGTFSGDGVDNAGKVLDPTIPSPGQFPIYYTVQSAEGCSATDTLEFTIHALPTKPGILYNANTLTSSETANVYTWYKDGVIIDNGANKSITFAGDGDYQLVITDANGCENASDIATLTNIASLAYTQVVNIYPNPAANTVKIDALKLDATIKLYDVVGKELMKMNLKANEKTEIDISALANGTYFIQINGKAHRLEVVR